LLFHFQHDLVRESVVICLGAMARHLSKDDPKVPPIIAKLIVALRTPSQQVHTTISLILLVIFPFLWWIKLTHRLKMHIKVELGFG
jgi:hypothetical protein